MTVNCMMQSFCHADKKEGLPNSHSRYGVIETDPGYKRTVYKLINYNIPIKSNPYRL